MFEEAPDAPRPAGAQGERLQIAVYGIAAVFVVGFAIVVAVLLTRRKRR